MNDRERIAARLMAAMIVHEGLPVDPKASAAQSLHLADLLLHTSRQGMDSLPYLDPETHVRAGVEDSA